MAVNYKRTKIGEGMYLNEIYDKKFKSNIIKVSFVTSMNSDTVCANALLPSVLITSNAEYKTRAALSEKLMGLYGSSITTNIGSEGNYQIVGLVANFIGDKYTIGGESVSEDVTKQLIGCLLYPDITDGKFNENYFRLRRQELSDIISSSVNDKRTYAYIRARKSIFAGEPCSASVMSDPKLALEITQEKLYERYEYLKRSAAVEVTVCGGGEIDGAVKMLTDELTRLDRQNVEKIVYRSNSPVKDEVCEIREKLDVTQCKTVMAYKSDYEDIYTAKLFTGLLGCTPFSKLFVNVREKLSLCYYCSAGYIDLKGTMVIQSGVEKANIERAREAVEEQVEQLKQGNFTDEELYNTKLYLCGLYKSNYDTTGDTASWYEAQITRGTELTPEQQSEILMNVTREQVIECAKSFRLDTVYVMESDSEVRDSE